MSVNFNRSKGKGITDNHTFRVKAVLDLDRYWDDYTTYYPKRNRGTHHCYPQLYSYQIRMYRTWKHSRKTQWKNS